MSAHVYWRLNFTAGNGSNIGLTEVGMRTSVGGATVTTGGTAGGTNVNGSFPAANAFDANTSTDYQSSAVASTLSYQFASAQAIVEYTLQASLTLAATFAPQNWTFEYSDDGATWTIAAYARTQTTWVAGEIRTFAVNAGAESGSELLSLRPSNASATPGNGARQPAMRSAGPATTVSGTISVSGTGTAGLIVRAYDKSSGAMVGQATSGSGGAYSINCGGFTDVYVAAFDPTTYQAVIYDEVVPG